MEGWFITVDAKRADAMGGIPINEKKPLVLCLNCKHFDHEYESYELPGCFWCDRLGMWCEPDFFCAYGKHDWRYEEL